MNSDKIYDFTSIPRDRYSMAGEVPERYGACYVDQRCRCGNYPE